jgi:hypothetical protein
MLTIANDDNRPSGPEWHTWQHTILTGMTDRLHPSNDDGGREEG